MEVKTKSELQTQKIGEEIAGKLKSGDIVCLYGDLGAGKTVFVKGIAKGLGIQKRILSPTFVLMRAYPGLYHLDLYRIDDFRSLGLDEIFENEQIKVIEWAEKLGSALPEKRIDVKIKKVNEKTRKITISRI
ncbi:MAG: tRNA (adenosine(37)-N6)-threonylcarbamoyltransferase complex ATPase subunit type 1 TsaE [Candidatus Curtissbacteria bacterium]|nr:tRNA (adenosine(37)-N6)-threonylcarbamoyltransferase complex ATPase subunit type 1 TsaE [Candidatus Curtissbacteria bacterium]